MLKKMLGQYANIYHWLPPFDLQVIIIPVGSRHVGIDISIAPGYALGIGSVDCGTHFSFLFATKREREVNLTFSASASHTLELK